MVNVVPVDAVIDDVPFIFTGNLEDGIMGCAVYLIFGHLLNNTVILFVNFDFTQWRSAGAVAYVVVG
jgi:hypothetical protein